MLHFHRKLTRNWILENWTVHFQFFDQEKLNENLTFKSFRFTVMVIQLSVENAMANKATATKLKIVAKANVTALQNPIFVNF